MAAGAGAVNDTVIIAIDIMQKTACNKCKQIINRDSSPQKFEFIEHKLSL